ncbi:hypothetical protein SO694_00048056 [Aureococcus anophagefferens]|uniref:RxLR effector protein n=1 Tax=Aureococcus anophagefferens TaxID=44056 RepID=A0ABR1G7S2_AURAN|mmetsp:Transcript_829/g.2787  ORF Transcript_829/g.2787 Transcript_829/m.2787 type:complete len:130 (-) Transcript_829:106-495(-)
MKLAFALLAGSAAAFAPQQSGAALGVRSTVVVNGYVPNGLTEAQYKAQLAKESAAKGQNKQRFPKGKATLGIDKWLQQMEAAQVLDGDNVKRSGHTYAKNKFETKEQFDAAKGRTAAEAKAKKPGFLNW